MKRGDKDAKQRRERTKTGILRLAVPDYGEARAVLNRFDCQAGKDYAVQAIPTNLLIDAEGKIVVQKQKIRFK